MMKIVGRENIILLVDIISRQVVVLTSRTILKDSGHRVTTTTEMNSCRCLQREKFHLTEKELRWIYEKIGRF